MVTVGALNGKQTTSNTTVRVPVLTNSRDMKEGTRLFCEVVKGEQTKRGSTSNTTWKTSTAKKAKQQATVQKAREKVDI